MNERGDTLVEVTFACAILAVVIIGCFAVASAAYRLGLNAREHTQAINLLQRQAEGLRSLRDSNNWQTFTSGTPNGVACGGFFHMVQVPTGVGLPPKWQAVSGSLTNVSLDPAFPTGSPFTFDIKTQGGVGCDSTTPEITFVLRAYWTPIGKNIPCNADPLDVLCNQTVITSALANLDGVR